MMLHCDVHDAFHNSLDLNCLIIQILLIRYEDTSQNIVAIQSDGIILIPFYGLCILLLSITLLLDHYFILIFFAFYIMINYSNDNKFHINNKNLNQHNITRFSNRISTTDIFTILIFHKHGKKF